MRVGNYELLARLGEGGMGVVHLARGTDGRRVALKVIRPNVIADDESRSRLAREVNSLSRVRSHRVAEVIDADPWGPVPYVATRYVPGLSLHDHIAQQGPLVVEDLLWSARCLAEALVAVHAAGVLHRDIKPSNVLMEGRSPVLIDFGLARVAEDSQITAEGWLLGTPGYIPPEVLHGDQATEASDVHSWAATVAWAATGRTPFGSGPHAAVFDRVRRGEHDLAGVPDEIRDLLEAALDPEPRNRPSLAAALTWLDDDDVPTLVSPPYAPIDDDAGTTVLQVPETRPVGLDSWGRATLPASAVPAEHYPARLEHLAPQESWGAPMAPAPLPARNTAPPLDPSTRWMPADAHVAPAVRGTEFAPSQHRDGGEPWGDPYVAEPPAAFEPAVGWAERFRRSTLTLSLALPVAGAASFAPWSTAILLALAVWLLRAAAGSRDARERRRATRGERWYDVAQSALGAPFHVLGAVPGTVLLLLWTLCFATAAGLLAFAFATGVPTGAAAAAGVGVLGMWCGPGAGRLRRPVRAVVRPVSSNGWIWAVALAAVLGLAWFAGSQTLLPGADGTVDWGPASSAPWDR